MREKEILGLVANIIYAIHAMLTRGLAAGFISDDEMVFSSHLNSFFLRPIVSC
jgi:hypothetical protein